MIALYNMYIYILNSKLFLASMDIHDLISIFNLKKYRYNVKLRFFDVNLTCTSKAKIIEKSEALIFH